MFSKEADVLKTSIFPQSPMLIVKKASGYYSNIWIVTDGKRIDAKSMMDMLHYGNFAGKHITIIADGIDEIAAVNAIADYVTSEYYLDVF